MYTSPASSPITTPRATPSSELTSSPAEAVALSENRDVMPLAAGEVTHHFPDAPLPRGIAEPRVQLLDGGEQCRGVLDLAREQPHHVTVGDTLHVLLVVRGEFIGLRTNESGGHGAASKIAR